MSALGLGYNVELDVFEGPLDLLLHLVKKHELDILDIPISFVTEKYLEYLDLMQSLDLDIAGEYLLMAATLAHIKSRELLPTPDPAQADEGDGDEEEIDPRQELIRRLLEYQKYKQAAHALGDRPVIGRNVWTRGTGQADAVAEEVDGDAAAPLAPFPVIKLVEAFDRVLARAKIQISHEVGVDTLSVSERLHQLVDRLEEEGAFSFSSCFRFLGDGAGSREQIVHEAVVTFLAVLEMAKLRLIVLSQPEGEEDIRITRAGEDIRERAARLGADDYR